MTAKQTFINLGPKRQKEILKAAYLEFARTDYENASLSAIVMNLGLAKGSFYRYFASKRDLYIYLLADASKERYSEIDTLYDNLPDSLEDLLIQNFRNKIEFDKKYPLQSGFLYRVLIEKNTDELADILLVLKEQILQKTQKILQKYADLGKLKKSIDKKAMAFSIMQMQIGIYDFIAMKYNINVIENIQLGKPVFGSKDKEVMSVVKDFAKIITWGINK